jgi:hypothetical protein
MVSACFKKDASVNNEVGSSLSKFKDFAGEITIFILQIFFKISHYHYFLQHRFEKILKS